MSHPYLIISDLHYHSWSAFSQTNASGVNSRLQLLLDATHEAAEALHRAGGDTIFIAGDTFHKRGSVEPSVLNPVMDMFRELAKRFKIYAIPGNHDLERNESERLGNAITALESCGVRVAHQPEAIDLSDDHKVVLFPWYSKVSDLLSAMTAMREDLVEDGIEADAEPMLDAIIHAPVDGVLPHLPSHGLDASGLSGTGFNRTFSGHYHNHKDLGDGVYSIGALTHQTWGDIGARAGYMLVYPDRVVQVETSHPKFVEITGEETDEEAIEMAADNYVRIRIEVSSDKELNEIREGVQALGARGVTVIPVKTKVVTRSGVPAAASGVSIESSIKAYLDKRSASASAHTLALDILGEARAA